MDICYLNPFSNQHQACTDFIQLNRCQKTKIVIVTICAAILTLWCFGIGGVAVFRCFVNRFKKIDIKNPTTDVPVKVDEVQKKVLPQEPLIEKPVTVKNPTTNIPVKVDEVQIQVLPLEPLVEKTIVTKEILNEAVPEIVDKPFQRLTDSLFLIDDQNFELNKAVLKQEFLNIKPLAKLIEVIKTTSEKKRRLLINILYVFFGLKPALIKEDFHLFDQKERELLVKITSLCPYFSIDYANSVAVNEQPRSEFDPRKFLKSMPSSSIKDSILKTFYRVEDQDTQNTSYLLGYGPCYDAYESLIGNGLYKSDLEKYTQFTDEHYRQLGESLYDLQGKIESFNNCVMNGKAYVKTIPNTFFENKQSSLNPEDYRLESNAIWQNKLKKYYLYFMADKISINTEYWKMGFRHRDRLFQIFDLPYYN